VTWVNQVGQVYDLHDPRCDGEPDQSNVEIPSPIAGVITSHEAQPGDVKAVGDIIVKIDPDAKPSAGTRQAEKPAAAPTEARQEAPRAQTTATDASPAATANGQQGSAAALADLSPAVRRMVSEANVDPSEIKGTGPGGRITKEDVQGLLDKPPAPPTPRPAPQKPSPPSVGGDKLPARPVAGVG